MKINKNIIRKIDRIVNLENKKINLSYNIKYINEELEKINKKLKYKQEKYDKIISSGNIELYTNTEIYKTINSLKNYLNEIKLLEKTKKDFIKKETAISKKIKNLISR